MGTNYYAIDKSEYCEHCGRGIKKIHIGKSSAGWCFSLHVYPEKGINNWADILEFLKGKEIIDEYGSFVSLYEFVDIVTDRRWARNKKDYDFSKDPHYNSLKHFLEVNRAELGPNNLLRHKIGYYCIGHGEGTYDYMIGDFS